MGNSSSQALPGGGGGGPGPAERRAWANSYPRERGGHGPHGPRGPPGGVAGPALRQPAHKVLPERVPGQRLRVTDNGAILHNGGTISGRRQPLMPGPGGFRPRSASQHQAPAPRAGSGGGGGGGGHGQRAGPMGKRFGSEPDLRGPARDRCDSPSKQRITRSRKKYKAPAPPPELDTSSPDSYHWHGGGGGCDTLDPPARRLRLFKTRAETKRTQQLQRRSDDEASPAPAAPAPTAPAPTAPGAVTVTVKERRDARDAPRHRPVSAAVAGVANGDVVSPKPMQRSLSSPEFQAELIQVAQRIKTPSPESESPAPPSLLPAPPGFDGRSERSGGGGGGGGVRGEREAPVGQAASASDSSPEPLAAPAPLLPPRRPSARDPPPPRPAHHEDHWEVLPQKGGSGRRGDVPARTFYFGMEQGEREAVERFAASLRRRAAQPPSARALHAAAAAGGSLSSDADDPDGPPHAHAHAHAAALVGLPRYIDKQALDDDEDESGLGGGSSGGNSAGGSGGGSGGGGGGIALQLRPTLPKKTPEIPRFSPTAAWRLLSALDPQHGPGTANSTATDEPPVLLEERIQGLARPVAPAVAGAASLLRPLAAPHSSHDKSGDSGISGDASPGGCADDAAAAAAGAPAAPAAGAGAAGVAPGAGGAAWTPQQDLEGEDESSSDGGVEALRAGRAQGPALPQRGLPVQPKYSGRAHVFSLSLPRDDRLCMALYAAHDGDQRDGLPGAHKSRGLRDVQPSFNSLKKLKRSVSGAFGRGLGAGAGAGGGGGGDGDRGQALDENWLLSRSVPNLLLHQPPPPPPAAPFAPFASGPASASASTSTPSAPSPALPALSADPPSFSYLASGGHVMYLPQYEAPRDTEALAPRGRCYSAGAAARDYRPGGGLLSKSCEDLAAAEMRQIRRSPSPESPPMGRAAHVGGGGGGAAVGAGGGGGGGGSGKPRSKGKRFTFQSTVRQIERRRLAERLSKEAELKERQRLSELEAMRQVEEEFQRKRAREKASIRQQLRLFSMDEKLYASLPAEWGDAGGGGGGAGARADPEGAPSSSQSSAHSGGGGKAPAARQPSSGSAASGSGSGSGSELKPPSTQVLSEFREPRREYREYRPTRYIDSGPESLPHMETKRATIHPPVVFDIPKSTQVYVTPHHHRNGDVYHDRGGGSTPRSSSSDNYRRDFAHGARPHGRSATSSDSDVSQVNGPASRQTSSGYQPSRQLRSRSASPELERTSISSNTEEGMDIPYKKDSRPISPIGKRNLHQDNADNEVSVTPTTADGARFKLTTLQPFVRNGKGYRPIVFNPRTSTSHNIAQTVS